MSAWIFRRRRHRSHEPTPRYDFFVAVLMPLAFLITWLIFACDNPGTPAPKELPRGYLGPQVERCVTPKDTTVTKEIPY